MIVGFLFAVACAPPESNVQKAVPNLLVVPEALDFGDVVVDYGATLPVTLFNGGLGGLEVTSATIDGDAAVWTVGALPTEALPKDAEYALNIDFVPADYVDYAATLTLVTNDESSPHTVTLAGTGVEAPTPDIAFDPLSIDFGNVTPLTTTALWTTVSNLGDGPLTIASVTQAGSGSFTLVTDMRGVVLSPGESQQVVVTYTPPNADGDSGGLTFASDDPDEPEVRVPLVGNGGADFDYPIAVIDGPSSIAPRETISLDGASSSDPSGYLPLSYEWTITTVPDGSLAGESLVTLTEEAVFTTDLAGVYEVELVVTNTVGLRSVPAVWEGDAIPEEQLHVELTWNTTAADLDLHLLDTDGELFLDPGDCNWCNQSPSWGATGRDDDPRLDIDDQFGLGPENINIDVPADGEYRIRVHYFTQNGDGDVAAHVAVYTYGLLAAEYDAVLTRDKVWDVAYVRWPEGLVVEEYTELYSPTRRTCVSE